MVTFLLARGGARDARRAALLARVRQLLGRRLGCVVADCGFTSRPALAALAAYGVPFGLGFARSRPVRARLDALSPQPRRWLRDGGAVRLGACPWDDRLRLVALGARSPTDTRGPSVYVTHPRAAGPQRLARTYRRRWRVEQALDELVNGHDLDHLVAYRLHPDCVAVGFLLARTLAIGLQVADAGGRPETICEPAAFRAEHADGAAIMALAPGAAVASGTAGSAAGARRLRPPLRRLACRVRRTPRRRSRFLHAAGSGRWPRNCAAGEAAL